MPDEGRVDSLNGHTFGPYHYAGMGNTERECLLCHFRQDEQLEDERVPPCMTGRVCTPQRHAKGCVQDDDTTVCFICGHFSLRSSCGARGCDIYHDTVTTHEPPLWFLIGFYLLSFVACIAALRWSWVWWLFGAWFFLVGPLIAINWNRFYATLKRQGT
jgi:hypothetical protein